MGDTNNDGYDDLVFATEPSTLTLLLGGPGGPSPDQAVPLSLTVQGGWRYDTDGAEAAGDVDGDGLADFAVWQGGDAWLYRSGQDDSGRDDSGPTEKRCGCGAVAPIPSLPLALVFLALARRSQGRRAAPEECPASDAAERRAGG